MRFFNILVLSAFLFALTLVLSKPIYNAKKSYITPITKLNFESKITKIRQSTKDVSLVHYFKYNDPESKKFAAAFDEFTNEFRGVFKIGACDCEEDAAVCEKEKISKYPTFRFYPPQPVPSVDYEGELDTKKILNFGARYLHSNIIEITPSNIDTFINDSPSVPKVFLFTDKKGLATIYKGLSVAFENKLFFGIIRSEHENLIERYNIKTFPKIIVVKTTEKKPFVYNGELKFVQIFDFLNVFSEAFVSGGGSSQDSAATKVWLTEVVPELNIKSANDICLKVEGVLCVIIIDNAKPEKKYIEAMKEAHASFDRKISRGSQFQFMWMDASKEIEWAKLFNSQNLPKLVILNPGTRKRFVEHEGAITGSAIKDTLEKINGGDAHFKAIKGKELPEFVHLKE